MTKLLALIFACVFLSSMCTARDRKASVPEITYMQDSVTVRNPDSIRKPLFVFKGKGYCGIFEIGLTDIFAKDSIANTPSYALHFINGGHINRYFSMGVGIGVDIGARQTDLSMGLDFRVQLTKRTLVPYIDLEGGYMVRFYHDYYTAGAERYSVLRVREGFYANPSVGVRYTLGPRFAVSFGLGYKFLTLSYMGSDGEYHLRPFNALTVRTGFNF
jgi:hypothetical protein